MAEDGKEPVKTFTQAELDAIIGDRLAREREKYADYDSLKADAEQWRSRQQDEKSELDKLRDELGTLKAEKEERDTRDAHARLVSEVMQSHKIDSKYADLLTASDKDGLERQAELIGERFAEPAPSEGGKPPFVEPKTDMTKEFAHRLFSGQ